MSSTSMYKRQFAYPRNSLEDLINLLFEVHVQQPVSLIKDQMLQRLQAETLHISLSQWQQHATFILGNPSFANRYLLVTQQQLYCEARNSCKYDMLQHQLKACRFKDTAAALLTQPGYLWMKLHVDTMQQHS